MLYAWLGYDEYFVKFNNFLQNTVRVNLFHKQTPSHCFPFDPQKGHIKKSPLRKRSSVSAEFILIMLFTKIFIPLFTNDFYFMFFFTFPSIFMVIKTIEFIYLFASLVHHFEITSKNNCFSMKVWNTSDVVAQNAASTWWDVQSWCGSGSKVVGKSTPFVTRLCVSMLIYGVPNMPGASNLLLKQCLEEEIIDRLANERVL